LGNNTQFGTENLCNLVVVHLVEVKGLPWDPSKSLVGQETPATNFVLQFDTGALKVYKELGKSFSKNCVKSAVNIKSKDDPQTAKGVQSRFVPPDRVRRSSPHIGRFHESATADFRHFGRRWIVDKVRGQVRWQSYRSLRLNVREGSGCTEGWQAWHGMRLRPCPPT
jgi:hypothetical protein